jgi:PBP1b-binding outer membrane lipoprotein LpoB
MEGIGMKRLIFVMIICLAMILSGCVAIEKVSPEKVEDTSGAP